MIFLTFLILSTPFAHAQIDKEVTFRDKVHISLKSYQTDRSPAPTEMNCMGFENISGRGVKARLKSSAGISYELDCQYSEIGSQMDLLVFKNKKQVSKLPDIASAGADCGYSYEKQSWLSDLNGDKLMDVITRSKSKNVPSNCGNGNQKAEAKDEITVFFWDDEKQEHVKGKLDAGDLKKFMRKYQF